MITGDPMLRPPDGVLIARLMTLVSTVLVTTSGEVISRALFEGISNRSTAARPDTEIDFTAVTANVPTDMLLVFRTV
jgi:hypothetical protein